MKKILFLCTGNSCRSQMAEGFAKFYFDDKFEIYSAGIEKHGMNLRAVKVMNEIGIDISIHFSKTIEELQCRNFDLVITVCSNANESCPVFQNENGQAAKIIHKSFDDPSRLAANLTNENDILNVYRKVRDEIKDYIVNDFAKIFLF